MGDVVDFEKARDRAAFEKMLERSHYDEKLKPVIREGFEKAYDRARERAHQAADGENLPKIDTRHDSATGAETIQQGGKSYRAGVVVSWVDPNPIDTRTPSEQKFSSGTGLDASHSTAASNGGPTGAENLNLFNQSMNRGTFNVVDNQTKEMVRNGDKVLQVTVDYYDPKKEGYGLETPVYEDRDRMVFPQDGSPRHEKLAPVNFQDDKRRVVLESRELAAPPDGSQESRASAPDFVDKATRHEPRASKAETACGDFASSAAKVDAIRVAIRQQTASTPSASPQSPVAPSVPTVLPASTAGSAAGSTPGLTPPPAALSSPHGGGGPRN